MIGFLICVLEFPKHRNNKNTAAHLFWLLNRKATFDSLFNPVDLIVMTSSEIGSVDVKRMGYFHTAPLDDVMMR